MEFQKSRVEIYSSEDYISGERVEISVHNVYMIDSRDLDTSFHESEYEFPEAGEDLRGELEDFREESLISWYGDRIYPTVADFKGYPSISLHISNSLFHDESMEKVMATELTNTVAEELEDFL